MTTKINIIQIITKHNMYTVGQVPGGLNEVVTRIIYHPENRVYNKAAQFDGASYEIRFGESNVKRFVMATELRELGIEKVEVDESTNKKGISPEEAGLGDITATTEA